MATYNFSARFAQLVETGRKRQTIRAERIDGRVPKAGDAVALYTGQRTKGCRLLKRSRITSVERITIDGNEVRIDGRYLYGLERHNLAVADGFTGWPDMRDWFMQNHGPDFWGWLIKFE